MAWRSFNLLMDKPRVLVLDTRSSASYAAGHIRGSVCIRLDPELGHKQSLSYVAGPGPPTWYPNCWWDRDVLLVLPPLLRSTRKRKKAIASSSLHPVFTFLKEEGLVRSIHVLENDDSDDGMSFSRRLFVIPVIYLTQASMQVFFFFLDILYFLTHT